MRDESIVRWAVRQLAGYRETDTLEYVFAQVPERLHAEVERRYQTERAAWEARRAVHVADKEMVEVWDA